VIRLFSVLVTLSPLNSSHSRLKKKLKKPKTKIANPTDDDKRELSLGFSFFGYNFNNLIQSRLEREWWNEGFCFNSTVSSQLLYYTWLLDLTCAAS